MNSETLFSLALGLQSPWQAKEVSFSVAKSGGLGKINQDIYLPFIKFFE